MSAGGDEGDDGGRSDMHFVRMRRSKLGGRCCRQYCSVVNYSGSVTAEMPMQESVNADVSVGEGVGEL